MISRGQYSVDLFMDVESLIIGCFEHNKKGVHIKVLAGLEYMFHGSCKKVSRVISLILEPISLHVVTKIDPGSFKE